MLFVVSTCHSQIPITHLLIETYFSLSQGHSVHPKLVKSVHFCPATKKTTERFYTDITSLDPMPSNFAYPTKDDQGNLLETEYGMCVYKDTQFFTLQELTEKAPTGQLPRSIGVICDEDLVDTIKPGDRVMVVGSYRCLPGKRNGFTNASFKTIILANNIKPIHHESLTTFVPEDIKKIKNFVKQQDVIQFLLCLFKFTHCRFTD